nr:cysteine--tRNA ligase [Helicobacter enhydrae]
MKIFDSVKKTKLPFQPIMPDQVKMYVCGPTVYDDSHLGHARSAIVFDLWRRLFLAMGYKVIFARNFTDIDDKIIKKHLESKQSVQEITSHYIQRYLDDMQQIGVLPPDLEPKATQNLDAMQKMIQTLLDQGYAYQTENGDIYLDSSKDDSYGSLSHRTQELENISRLQTDTHKRSERDFVLWKSYKGATDIGYPSPFGKGRPGWHIECSAMIEEHLAYSIGEYGIDIHGGGADLLFPHHENEASQTRCATKRELAKYWLHNGFVRISGEKMSKSLGNSFFLKDILKLHHGEVVRNYLLGTHYRAHFDFDGDDLLQSKKRLDKIYRLKKRLKDSVPSKTDEHFSKSLLLALCDDLNISQALSLIEQMIKESNDALDQNPKNNQLKSTILANLELIGLVIGIGTLQADAYFQLGVSQEQQEWIATQIQLRQEAKANKNYALADEIRERLKNQGIILSDTPTATIWEKISQ